MRVSSRFEDAAVGIDGRDIVLAVSRPFIEEESTFGFSDLMRYELQDLFDKFNNDLLQAFLPTETSQRENFRISGSST